MFEKTMFPYFNVFCIQKFGEDTGSQIYKEACHKLKELCAEADWKNNKSIKCHMMQNMLPAIAIYLTFKQFETTSENALDYTDDVMQSARLEIQKKNKRLGGLPFAYSLFKIFCKGIMNYEYPEQGWEVEWVKYDKDEIHFNMKSCIYLETTQKYNCPELCPLFCQNDDVTLKGYEPAIVFEREYTIAKGGTLCDFHFKNGKVHS